jgi:SAM-dependent methyltransferase
VIRTPRIHGIIQKLRAGAPWWMRVVAKLVLARLPVPYGIWSRLSLFKHGGMDRPEYVFQVFQRHFAGTHFMRRGIPFTALELGPGDTLSSALVACAFGASRCYLVDTGEFARSDVAPYRRMVAFLKERDLPVAELGPGASLRDVLSVCNGIYLTEGLRSLRTIESESVDFIWSHAALEHVSRAEVSELLNELYRILRLDGVASHTIDLGDHLGGGLNQLRFSVRFWENELVRRSGFYTNRLCFSEWLTLFANAGFDVVVPEVRRWSSIPIPRRALAAEFQGLPDADLLVLGFDVLSSKGHPPSRARTATK